MKPYFSSFRIKVFVISLLITIAIGSFIYTQYLIQKIRANERNSIELWAKAMEYTGSQHYDGTRQLLNGMIEEVEANPLISSDQKRRWREIVLRANSDLNNAAVDFVASEIIINNQLEIPSVGVNEQMEILYYHNVDEDDLGVKLIEEFAALNDPITIYVGEGDTAEVQYFYYGDSTIVRTLKIFPFVQFGLLALFLGLGYAMLSSIKRNEQSNLWVGMARESAHQLGTPISSLMGWVAILKDTVADEEALSTIHELEKDVDRLQTIADRFNKIGSSPELKPVRIGPVLKNVTDYMERRLPKMGRNIEVRRNIEMEARVSLNAELFMWAIENILKNAMDAIDTSKEHQFVKIESSITERGLIIDIRDSGKGIEKKYFNEIFSPGFSTKKRGWGLGLSLTKRIVEEYHNGSVFVEYSAPGKGTQFRIILPLANTEGGEITEKAV